MVWKGKMRLNGRSLCSEFTHNIITQAESWAKFVRHQSHTLRFSSRLDRRCHADVKEAWDKEFVWSAIHSQVKSKNVAFAFRIKLQCRNSTITRYMSMWKKEKNKQAAELRLQNNKRYYKSKHIKYTGAYVLKGL